MGSIASRLSLVLGECGLMLLIVVLVVATLPVIGAVAFMLRPILLVAALVGIVALFCCRSRG